MQHASSPSTSCGADILLPPEYVMHRRLHFTELELLSLTILYIFSS